MTARRWLLLLLLVAVAGAAAGGWLWWTRAPRVLPPVVDLSEENDPVLADAVAAARKKVLAEPKSADAWGTLGKLLLANGFGEDARPCFAQAAALAPTDARWPYLHGLAQQPIGPDEAVPLFAQAAERIADDAPAAGVVRWRYAEALIRVGRRDEAKELLLGVLKQTPNEPRALVTLGILAHDDNDLKTAEEYFLRCMQSPYARQRATTRLAGLSLQKGDPASAERYRQQARRLPRDPDGPDPIAEEYKDLLIGRRARLLRAEYLLRAGSSPEAIALLRRLLEEHPDEPEASVKLGMALAEAGQFAEAERVLRAGLDRRGGERVQARYFLCVALFNQAEQKGGKHRYSEAAAQARRVVTDKPDHAYGHLFLGLSLQRLNKKDEALKELEQAVRYSPESVDPHLHYGEALVAAGQRAKGMTHLDRAVELAGPDDPRPRRARDALAGQ